MGQISLVYVVFKVSELAAKSVSRKHFKILNFLKDFFAHFMTRSEKRSSGLKLVPSDRYIVF